MYRRCANRYLIRAIESASGTGMKLSTNALAAMPRLKWFALGAALYGVAATDVGAHSGKFAGALVAAALAAIVAYAYAICVAPISRDRDPRVRWILAALGLIAIFKLIAIPHFPGFGPDVGSYQAWALQIADNGPARTYQQGYFLDYPPGYLYALWIVGSVARVFNVSGDTLRLLTESPPVIADFALALAAYAYMYRVGRRRIAPVVAMLIALNPMMLFDTVVWGQSDSILTLIVVLALVSILEDRYELAWALAAISVLVKPQGMMILPVLALWTMLETPIRRWVISALVFIATFAAGVAPFQIGHPWHWIIDLYTSTAAYYHETSVNAFNLMALVGGLRTNDADSAGGISYFTLGMSMLVPLYAYAGWIVWRGRSPRRLVFVAMITIFGFFMVAPRMHERYIYPAVALAAFMAFESGEMLAVFCILTLTGWFNLAYVLHTLNTIVFLPSHDALAMIASALNLAVLAIAGYYGATGLNSVGNASSDGQLEGAVKEIPARADHVAPASVEAPPPPWTRVETWALAAIVAVGALTRFWRLDRPPEIVFDEVHFVGQARHYLNNEWFLDPHPPLAKLVIAAGIWAFGDHPWAWRIGNAIIGTALIGVTYLVARRISRSRLAAALAASFIVVDGLFMVDSRIAVIDIVYITCAAVAYLLFFRWRDAVGIAARRSILPWLGVALGLGLASKLYVPAITCLLIAAFLAFVIVEEYRAPTHESGAAMLARRSQRTRMIAGSIAVVAGVSAIAYLTVFMSHAIEGWWRGTADLFGYYHDVLWYEDSVSSATHPYSSPWWSWPLMLRPVAYWQSFPKTGDPVAAIWGGGNPVLWWGGFVSITIMAVKATERPSLSRIFIVAGYLSYLVIWIWIGRTLFLYHYMASVYLAYIAMAWLIADCWNETAEPWEHMPLLFTLCPAIVFGLGPAIGITACGLLMAGYVAMLARTAAPGRFTAIAFCACALIAFVYFFPLWTGMPITREGYYQRMWLQRGGLFNWI
jgi:Gpi18-like mannosyltransferase